MDRRRFILSSLGSVFALTACQYEALTEIKKQYPNVLMLVVDDLNDWIGPMQGHPNTKTPNIDRLAAKGTVFQNAHAPAPLCGPSRASILTGLAPSSTGIYGQVKDDDIKKANPKAAESLFLSEYFRQHGYYTAAVGKIFHHGIASGSFDVFGGRVKAFGPYPDERFEWKDPRTNTDWGAFPERDEQMPDYDTANWLVEHLAMKHDKPFFIAGGFLRPHVPWYVPKKWFDMHPLDEIELPPYLADDLADVPDIAKAISEHPMMPTTEWALEKNEWKKIVQAYLASISFVDHCIGMVLDALENSAYADNTAVVMWGDHGYSLGEKSKFAKMSLWDRATRTPLIISPPKNQIRDQVTNEVRQAVSLLDLYPTLIKICGLPENPLNQGVDLSALMHQPDADWPHAAVMTYGPNNHAVKTSRYRYIRYADGSEELYDHDNDSNEWHNLANDPRYFGVKQELMRHLPEENVAWSPVSSYNVNPYFKALSEAAQTTK